MPCVPWAVCRVSRCGDGLPQRAVPQPTTVSHYSLAMPDRWAVEVLIVLLGIVLPIILLLSLAWHYLF